MSQTDNNPAPAPRDEERNVQPLTDPFSRGLRMIGLVVAAAIALHAIYVAFVGQYVSPELIRAGAMFACALIVIFTSPLAANLKVTAPLLVALCWAIDLALLANLGWSCWNFLKKIDDIENLIAEF